MARVWLGLGSNVDPQHHLRLAVSELEAVLGELRLSPVYRSRAMGFDGPDFLNLVAGCDTARSIAELNDLIEAIHARCGRERDGARLASRMLDIDLLLWGDTVAERPVRLPRPDVLDYAFVLRPLAAVAPRARHPLTGRTYAGHWQTFGGDAVGLCRTTFDPRGS